MRGRLGSIRVRTTVAAVIVVGVALSLASVAMVTVLMRSLRGQVAATAVAKADSLAQELESEIRVEDLVLGDPDEDEEFVQIVDAEGVVLGSSPNLSGWGLIELVRPGTTQRIPARNPPDVEPFDDPFLLVASDVEGAGDIDSVIVGRNLETVEEGRSTLTIALPHHHAAPPVRRGAGHLARDGESPVSRRCDQSRGGRDLNPRPPSEGSRSSGR